MTRKVVGIPLVTNLKWKGSFLDWIKRWEACTNVQEALAILHTIYGYSLGEDSWNRSHDDERHEFLLALADGHAYTHSSVSDPDTGPHPQLRYKAFGLLAQNLFKQEPHISEHKSRAKRLAPALLAFFEGQGNVSWPVGGSSGDHNKRVANEYFKQCCRQFWFGAMDSSVRIRVLNLLYREHEIGFIIPKDASCNTRDWDFITDDVLVRLEELVQEEGESTIEEAVYKGSAVARVLLAARAAREGKRRTDERQMVEAAQRLKNLSQ